MIRITVELLPLGDELGKRMLGVATIANDGDGSEKIGHYTVKLGKMAPKETEIWRTGAVQNFPRQKRGCWDLIYLALRNIVSHRNP